MGLVVFGIVLVYVLLVGCVYCGGGWYDFVVDVVGEVV